MFTPILATLGYILSPDKSQVLMIHRNKRPDDLHFGKYNGLGGRIEPDEDIITGMRREIFEESGLIADQVLLRGTISWPGFGKHGEAWFGFIFRIETWHGEAHEGMRERHAKICHSLALSILTIWQNDHIVRIMLIHFYVNYTGTNPLPSLLEEIANTIYDLLFGNNRKSYHVSTICCSAKNTRSI